MMTVISPACTGAKEYLDTFGKKLSDDLVLADTLTPVCKVYRYLKMNFGPEWWRHQGSKKAREEGMKMASAEILCTLPMNSIVFTTEPELADTLRAERVRFVIPESQDLMTGQLKYVGYEGEDFPPYENQEDATRTVLSYYAAAHLKGALVVDSYDTAISQLLRLVPTPVSLGITHDKAVGQFTNKKGQTIKVFARRKETADAAMKRVKKHHGM